MIALSASNDEGSAGALAALMIVYADGKSQEVVSDSSWKVLNQEGRGPWRTPEFDDKAWASVQVLGKLGDKQLPWSGTLGPDAITENIGTGSKGEFTPVIADNAQGPAGFQIEKFSKFAQHGFVGRADYRSPRPLVASDQGGAGLFQITPGTQGQPTRVEKMRSV